MFKLLETFKTVYETRNFSKASERLFISQPAVSNQIKQLEADLKVKLFVRNGRQEIYATAQADILYHNVLILLEDWEAIKHKMLTLETRKIKCRLAASHTFAIHILPKLLEELFQVFPTIDFSIQMMNSYEVFSAIQSHELEFGFIERPLATGSIARTPLMDDQLVYVGAKNQPWLIREATSGVYYYQKRYMEEHNINLPTIEVQNNELIVALLKRGVGQTVISKRAVQGFDYENLSEEYLRQFYLIQRDHLVHPLLMECIAYIQEWAKSQPLD